MEIQDIVWTGTTTLAALLSPIIGLAMTVFILSKAWVATEITLNCMQLVSEIDPGLSHTERRRASEIALDYCSFTAKANQVLSK